MSGKKDDFKDSRFTEIEATENILNLDYYLHRAIIKWQDSLDIGIRQGKINDGLVARYLNAEMAVICASAKGLICWESDETFQKELEAFKKALDETDKNIRKTNIADFKIKKIMVVLNEHKIKDGKVVM